jgi:hypothetical protein
MHNLPNAGIKFLKVINTSNSDEELLYNVQVQNFE